MNKLFFLLAFLILLSCGNNQSEQLRQQARNAVSQPQAAQTSQVSLSEGITLSVGKTKAQKGEEFCLGVSARDFKGIISMQYSIRWDPKVLRFDKVEGFNLPWLSVENFGMHVTDEGLLTFVWIENDLKGFDLNNGDYLYQLCFEAIGEAGSETEVIISEDPTPMEVVTASEQIIPLKAVAGGVKIE